LRLQLVGVPEKAVLVGKIGRHAGYAAHALGEAAQPLGKIREIQRPSHLAPSSRQRRQPFGSCHVSRRALERSPSKATGHKCGTLLSESIQIDRRFPMWTMQRALLATFVGLAFATPGMTTVQAQDMKQVLGGLLTGNQDRDNAVQQAYERGYQRGRTDEARQSRRGPGDSGGYYQERGGYSNSR
jgi:hypothetical protein